MGAQGIKEVGATVRPLSARHAAVECSRAYCRCFSVSRHAEFDVDLMTRFGYQPRPSPGHRAVYARHTGVGWRQRSLSRVEAQTACIGNSLATYSI
jgi:hypothetical protein